MEFKDRSLSGKPTPHKEFAQRERTDHRLFRALSVNSAISTVDILTGPLEWAAAAPRNVKETVCEIDKGAKSRLADARSCLRWAIAEAKRL